MSFGGKSASRRISVVDATAVKSENTIKAEFKANKKSTVYNGYEINYVEREPDCIATESDPVPLVLFLHGAGERGNDNESQIQNSIAKAYQYAESTFYDSYVIAPQCPYRETEDGQDIDDDNPMDMSYTKWVDRNWTEGNYDLSDVAETKALATVADLVESYAARPEIDASRVYVVGLSMVGYGTWNIIANHAELFAATVPMCGGGPINRAEQLSDMPIYALHGTADATVPYDKCTLPLYNAIKAYNKNNMIFVPMQNEGHGIWDNVWIVGSDSDTKYKTYENTKPPRVIDWLFAQHKAN